MRGKWFSPPPPFPPPFSRCLLSFGRRSCGVRAGSFSAVTAVNSRSSELRFTGSRRPVPLSAPLGLLPIQRERELQLQSTSGHGHCLVPLLPHDETGNLLPRGVPRACGGTRSREEDDGDGDGPEWEPVSASSSPAPSRQQLPHVARPR